MTLPTVSFSPLFRAGLIGALLLAGNSSGWAQQMRQFSLIATPTAAGAESAALTAPSAALPGAIDRQSVADALGGVADAWSNGRLNDVLADDFQQGERLQEAMQFEVPRDAQIRVESVRNIASLGQRRVVDANGQLRNITTVTATVQTRIDFNDAANGFVSVPGANELVLEIVEINP